MILDSLNYIKGFRYELFCLARTAKSTHAVLYCDTSLDQAREWNQANQVGFNEDLFEDLCKRMEEPNYKSKNQLKLNFRKFLPFQSLDYSLIENYALKESLSF